MKNQNITSSQKCKQKMVHNMNDWIKFSYFFFLTNIIMKSTDLSQHSKSKIRSSFSSGVRTRNPSPFAVNMSLKILYKTYVFVIFLLDYFYTRAFLQGYFSRSNIIYWISHTQTNTLGIRVCYDTYGLYRVSQFPSCSCDLILFMVW